MIRTTMHATRRRLAAEIRALAELMDTDHIPAAEAEWTPDQAAIMDALSTLGKVADRLDP